MPPYATFNKLQFSNRCKSQIKPYKFIVEDKKNVKFLLVKKHKDNYFNFAKKNKIF